MNPSQAGLSPDRLLTTEEAAEVLCVSYSWLKKAAQRREVPCTHIGGARFASPGRTSKRSSRRGSVRHWKSDGAARLEVGSNPSFASARPVYPDESCGSRPRVVIA